MTVHLTVRQLAGDEKAFTDAKRTRPAPLSADAIAGTQELYLAAPAKGHIVADAFLESATGYYVEARADGQRAEWWHWATTQEFLRLRWAVDNAVFRAQPVEQ